MGGKILELKKCSTLASVQEWQSKRMCPSSARVPKLQLAVEQPSTVGPLSYCPKTVRTLKKTRPDTKKKHSKMVGGARS